MNSKQLVDGDQQVKLGGVWKQLHDSSKESDDRRLQVEEELKQVSEERDALRAERDDLLQQFRHNLSSLTETTTNQMETQKILETIRSEKQYLESRVSSLETQREWWDKQRGELTQQLAGANNTNQELTGQLSDAKTEAAAKDHEIEGLNKKVAACEGRLAASDTAGRDLQKMVSVLKKSVSSKSAQVTALLREKLELSEKFFALQKSMPPAQRNVAMAKLAGKPSPSKKTLESAPIDADVTDSSVQPADNENKENSQNDSLSTVKVDSLVVDQLVHLVDSLLGNTAADESEAAALASRTTDKKLGGDTASSSDYALREQRLIAVVRILQTELQSRRMKTPRTGSSTNGSSSVRKADLNAAVTVPSATTSLTASQTIHAKQPSANTNTITVNSNSNSSGRSPSVSRVRSRSASTPRVGSSGVSAMSSGTTNATGGAAAARGSALVNARALLQRSTGGTESSKSALSPMAMTKADRSPMAMSKAKMGLSSSSSSTSKMTAGGRDAALVQ